MFEIIIKYISICLMSIFLLILGFTGWYFQTTDFGEQSVALHKYIGFLLLIITALHVYLKRGKFLKLTSQFMNILKGKEIETDSNTSIFLKSIENLSIKDFTEFFGISTQTFQEALNRLDIKNHDDTKSLKEFSKQNNIKIFSIISRVFEIHISQKNLRT